MGVLSFVVDGFWYEACFGVLHSECSGNSLNEKRIALHCQNEYMRNSLINSKTISQVKNLTRKNLTRLVNSPKKKAHTKLRLSHPQSPVQRVDDWGLPSGLVF